MSDLPAQSFGFVKGPVRVLRDVKLLYLSLDLEPGPYGSVPHVVDPRDRAGEDDPGGSGGRE